jgi:hypothetical protein
MDVVKAIAGTGALSKPTGVRGVVKTSPHICTILFYPEDGGSTYL